MIKFLFLICAFFVLHSPIYGNHDSFVDLEQSRYTYNPRVPLAIWDELTPYFLPDNHPIKESLDKLAAKSRFVSNIQAIDKAGFDIRKYKDNIFFVTVFHDKLKGYVLKIFLDDYHYYEWDNFLKRIRGAQVAREAIDRNGYQSILKVPQKWIYPLPLNPAPINDAHPRSFILVVEDMKILHNRKNYLKWKTSKMTEELLFAFYTVLNEAGLADNIYPFNSVFSKDGKLALIDTEYYHCWPIRFNRTTKYLSSDIRPYWEALIINARQ